MDRAALDAARASGLAVRGWCPKNRKAEDGAVPAIYPLTETPSKDYEQRTRWNIRDSDATLILYRGELSGGSLFTKKAAEVAVKPLLAIELSLDTAVKIVGAWLAAGDYRVLNVAGPRESGAPGIGEQARQFLAALLTHQKQQ